MKNLLLVILASTLFVSCAPKHETLIDEYMKENLHDYSSYEPIGFEVDSIDVEDYFTYDGSSYYDKRVVTYAEPIKPENIDRIFKLKSGNKCKITHKYRANNGHGALRLGTIKFIVDKDMTEILHSEIIKNYL